MSGHWAASALMLGVAVLVSSCSTTTPTPPPDTRTVVTGQARLDQSTNTVFLPLDKYSGPRDGVIGYAQRISEKMCMEALGFDYQISTSQTVSDPVGWRLFGLWNLDEAKKYGYGIAPDPSASGFDLLNPNMSEKMVAAHQDCSQKSITQFQGDPSAPTISVYNYGMSPYEDTLASTAGKKLIAEWQKCMTDQGIAVDSNGSGPLSADVDVATIPLEQQIKIAVQEIECKTQGNNIVQQLADINASFQVVVIEKNQAILNQSLTNSNAQHKFAEDFILKNG